MSVGACASVAIFLNGASGRMFASAGKAGALFRFDASSVLKQFAWLAVASVNTLVVADVSVLLTRRRTCWTRVGKRITLLFDRKYVLNHPPLFSLISTPGLIHIADRLDRLGNQPDNGLYCATRREIQVVHIRESTPSQCRKNHSRRKSH